MMIVVYQTFETSKSAFTHYFPRIKMKDFPIWDFDTETHYVIYASSKEFMKLCADRYIASPVVKGGGLLR